MTTTTTCGWCGIAAHMMAMTDLVTPGGTTQPRVVQAAYLCANCNHFSLATETDPGPPYTVHHGMRDEAQAHPWGPDVQWLPVPDRQREFPDVPPHIADAATEATLCLSSGAHRAVGSLARAVLEAVAKDKKITTGTLHAKITALAAGGHLRPHTAEVAHEIRHFGNTMAHGDFTDPVDADEAATTVELMSEVLQEVYQNPARVDRVRRAREAKKTTDQTPAT